MPAPFIMPSQSGIDTPSVIQKLIEAERIPLKRLEEDNRRNEIRIKAWEELRTKAKKLSDISRDIYSFTGPFTHRKITSSDEGAITGTVSPNVEEVNQKIQVLQLAKKHKIHSHKIHKEEQLPQGKFSIIINQKELEFDFKGGSLNKLERILREKANDYDVSIVQVDSDHIILTLASKISGKMGKMEFKDPDDLLKKIEIIGLKGKKEEKEEILIFKKEDFKEHQDKITINQNEFSFQDVNNVNYLFPLKDKITEIIFRLEYKIEEIKNNITKTKEKIYIGPDIRNKIDGVELLAPQIERERITDKETSLQQSGEKIPGKIIINYISSGTIKQKEILLKENQKEYHLFLKELEGENANIQIQSIEFIKNFQGIFYLKELKIKKILEKETVYEPLHEIEPPQDAKLLVNGVEVVRSSNENLTDIIPGVSLNLHRVTNHEVELKVEYDITKIKEKIKEWVNAYNDLLLFIKENDKFNRDQDFEINRSSDPNERIEDGLRKLEDSSGIFAGDPIARRLVSVLSFITGNAYPTKLKPSFRTLAQIGISTGRPGSNWQDIKQGILIIDETVLDDALKNHPESVKELFALDKNEDAVVDDGVAYNVYDELSPYVKFAGGIITTRIDLLKEQIKTNKKIIYNKELSLSRKEEMLRKKFGNMESTIQNTKNMGKFLQNKLGIKNE
ncbi:MAG: flagellar hook-associated protein 2 [Leptospiraceae bacterium]|nr:MAG: flagellar hook-associated protein 2 [Leptospiraceae bacterium]